MRLIVTGAAQVVTCQGPDLGVVKDGTVVIDDGRISWVGARADCAPSLLAGAETCVDATGCIITPGFVDCHTHLVFAGWRDDEFELRLQGMSYKDISLRGGGIWSTVRKTRLASRDELFSLARARLQSMLAWGTTTCEIKSGYGLDTETELKLLRVIQRLKDQPDCGSLPTVVATFLGAHSVPPGLPRTVYVEQIINEMIPEVARQHLAEFCDVFCEEFVFPKEDARRILEEGKAHGLRPKIHADEIESSGGAETAAAVGAISADHLLAPSEPGLRAMRERNVTAVLLPGTSFYLGSRKAPVALLRGLGIPMALGSDFNPGSCTIAAMPLVIALACIHYGMTITEALLGATINAARALGLEHRKGSIEPGKDADLLVLAIPNYRHIPYRVGHNPVRHAIVAGRVVFSSCS